MNDLKFISDELGIEGGFSSDLLEASTKFMIAFYYSEVMFFDRDMRFDRSSVYASQILEAQKLKCEDCIESTFSFFKNRYFESEGAQQRLYELTMSTEDKPKNTFPIIKEHLTKSSSIESKLTTCLMVCIRVRNNLFHANKFEAIERNPQDQADLIARCYELLSSLIKSR